MGTHNICLYKGVDKNYTDYNLKTMELLDCALIGACAVIRSNMVYVCAIIHVSRNMTHSKCPKILYTKVSDQTAYANSAEPVQEQSDKGLQYLPFQ